MAQLDLLWNFVDKTGAGEDLLRNCQETKAYKNDIYLLPKELDAKMAKLHLLAFDAELLAIRRNSSQIELDVQQFFVLEGSCRSRPALEELDVQQFFAIEGSCRRRISEWKSRAQVVRELPQSPQGTTASTTPPFRRVVCVINALVPQGRLRHQRPRSAGSTA